MYSKSKSIIMSSLILPLVLSCWIQKGLPKFFEILFEIFSIEVYFQLRSDTDQVMKTEKISKDYPIKE